jgi:uncharacterized protein YeaO (DUF488 family)
VARDEARIDAWIKDIAPSDALRRWYAHDPEKWRAFRARHTANRPAETHRSFFGTVTFGKTPQCHSVARAR